MANSKRRIFHCGKTSTQNNEPWRRGSQVREEIDLCDFALLTAIHAEVTLLQAADAALVIARGKPLVFAERSEGDAVSALKMAASCVFSCCDDPFLAEELATIAVDHNPTGTKLHYPWACQFDLVRSCESPAEVRLAVHLMNHEMGFGGSLFAQHEIRIGGKRYRADFAIVSEGDPELGVPQMKIVIEVDGHDFHERTKQQAARDRSRDRAMLMDGWHVLRFTGSEVWANPDRCARQVADLCDKLCNEDEETED